jgi:hypothetical protein
MTKTTTVHLDLHRRVSHLCRRLRPLRLLIRAKRENVPRQEPLPRVPDSSPFQEYQMFLPRDLTTIQRRKTARS